MKEKNEARADASPTPAEEAAPPEGAPLEDELAQLQSRLAEQDAQLRDYQDRLRRVQADFQNYKKRKEREQEEIFLLIEDRLLAEILPLFDDFERAFRSLAHNRDQDSFIEGMEHIFAKFKDYLDRKEVKALDVVGKKFDPALHEVLLTVEDAGEPHVVLEEFERGYVRQGRLLRPSRVKVSKPQSAPRAEETSEGV